MATDPQTRQRLRDFWSDVLAQLETELHELQALQSDGWSIIPKDWVDKAAKTSDQIRRDFETKPNKPNKPNNPNESGSQRPSLNKITLN